MKPTQSKAEPSDKEGFLIILFEYLDLAMPEMQLSSGLFNS